MRFPGFGLTTLWIGSIALTVSLPAQTLQHRPATGEVKEPQQTDLRAIESQPELPAGTSLQVEIQRNYPMKAGEVIEGRMVYPLYANGKLVVPANTPVRGVVTSLEPDRKTRVSARLDGDFTPFRTPNVQFDQLLLPGGAIPMKTGNATTGAPIIQLVAPGVSPRQSMLARQWARAKSNMHDQIAFFTAPGFGDRALQVLYHQLPYHPQRIAANTAWTFELVAPVTLPKEDVPSNPPPPIRASGSPEVWSVHAVLIAGVTSATAKPGDPVEALVTEPVFDRAGELVVPQGSVLAGKVTTAKSARSLGRNGKLRFTFQQIRFPAGEDQAGASRSVEGALSGANTQGPRALSMDAEGTVTPKNKSSAIAPLLLTMLAGRVLDEDGSFTAQATVSSNGFGLVGRVVGIAAGSRELAAGIGYYAAALSTYRNFLSPGHDVDFPRNTRIEIETTPLRAPVLKPSGQ
jgi:hypothetical protein